jgi:metal-responsive CopG/Arc/MetJ family transcriptional regulator
VVSISPADLRVKAKRINISLPERVLDAVDPFAKAENETRSGLLVKAATAYIRQLPKRPRRPRTRQKK